MFCRWNVYNNRLRLLSLISLYKFSNGSVFRYDSLGVFRNSNLRVKLVHILRNYVWFLLLKHRHLRLLLRLQKRRSIIGDTKIIIFFNGPYWNVSGLKAVLLFNQNAVFSSIVFF